MRKLSALNTRRLIKIAVVFATLATLAISQSPSVLGKIERIASTPPVQDAAQQEFFEKKIRPTFANNCQRCHNPKAKVAGLDLTTAEAFLRGGASGPVVNKEKPEESRLLKVISYDSEMKMPPSGKLKDHEIAALTEWVKMGAPWPGAVQAVASENRPKNSSVRPFTEEENTFWSYQPAPDAAPKLVKAEAWIKSPVDRFVLSKLEEKNLKPAPAADKMTLLRRATFDLTGLPPTEAEMRDFLVDSSPDAFKKVVERLLGSPRYGERWGRHWLDVARYADSTGNDEDHRYPYAWKYRDYVIESFNNDLPYDQFVREQVAGDLLPAKDGGASIAAASSPQAFWRSARKPSRSRTRRRCFTTCTTSRLTSRPGRFMGLTVSCARCHDHKFDPILTKDYYSLIIDLRLNAQLHRSRLARLGRARKTARAESGIRALPCRKERASGQRVARQNCDRRNRG